MKGYPSMKIGVMGTGIVGQTIASKLEALGHDVVMGTRDVKGTMERNTPGMGGAPPFTVWQKQHQRVKVVTFSAAAEHGEAIWNATNGSGALEALRLGGEANLNGKILVDISNPLDFSRGMPPSLLVCNTDSLGEQIQRAIPGAKVVKTLNTVTASVMVNPGVVADRDHQMFVAGNDSGAKLMVTGWLGEWFGWKGVLDLGDITASRALEMYLPLWVRLYGVLQTPMFNIKIMR
jgi:8-hydroxy-5-deazaflavin:NADPH oxidoreductase